MDQSRKIDANEVGKLLTELSDASRFLEAHWFAMDFASRDKTWWRVHKASRAVWNVLHPPHPNSFTVTGKTGKVKK